MKKNSKNLSAPVQSQLSQQQATPLSTLTMNELESLQGGRWSGQFAYVGSGRCMLCPRDNYDY